MGLEVNKKSDTLEQKSTLSKFGKIVILLGVLFLIFLIVLLFISSNKKNNQKKIDNALDTVIISSLNVAEQSILTSNVKDSVIKEFEKLKSDIVNTKDIKLKYNKSLDLITFCLSNTSHNQSAVDELNAMRNRLEFANKRGIIS
jgi:preprotein translocase subunit SecG